MEWKLFEGDSHEFETAEWHEPRDAANHLENQPDRINRTFELALMAVSLLDIKTISDLGCGDGGLLSLVSTIENIRCWGYDLAPNNVAYAKNVRGMDVRYTDFKHDTTIEYGDLSIMSEVLEHLVDPHKTLRDLPSDNILVSCPLLETGENHYEFHLWAWDWDGYEALIQQGGYKILHHEAMDWSQAIVATRT